jgi:hypothetical protein
MAALEIRAKRHGFRRCGMAHSATPTVHPDGTFSDSQVATLKTDPMLVVKEIATDAPFEAPGVPDSAITAPGTTPTSRKRRKR